MAEILTTSELAGQIEAAFLAAETYQLPHSWLQGQIQEIKTELFRKVGSVKPRMRYSVHQQGFVLGYLQSRSNFFYKHHITVRRLHRRDHLVYRFSLQNSIFFWNPHAKD